VAGDPGRAERSSGRPRSLTIEEWKEREGSQSN
jgi:hypothetical protein